MKLAIMQPYFLPYLGYWQLLSYVDRFVIYDDVNYIKGGWVNRNRVLVNGKSHYVTVPIQHASSNKLICETKICNRWDWRSKLLKTVYSNYRRWPFFDECYSTFEQIIGIECDVLGEYLARQIVCIASSLKIETELVLTSRSYGNSWMTGEARVLDICLQEGANVYVNASGGQQLYNSNNFQSKDIQLRFIRQAEFEYPQRNDSFFPYLSIIDTVMALGWQGTSDLLSRFQLLPKKEAGN